MDARPTREKARTGSISLSQGEILAQPQEQEQHVDCEEVFLCSRKETLVLCRSAAGSNQSTSSLQSTDTFTLRSDGCTTQNVYARNIYCGAGFLVLEGVHVCCNANVGSSFQAYTCSTVKPVYSGHCLRQPPLYYGHPQLHCFNSFPPNDTA